jgi:three-Cys-motif partner protein
MTKPTSHDVDPRLFKDDDLPLPEVGIWAITKHTKIEYYTSTFARSMKNKWDCRIYLDLFSGAGKCKIKGSNKIIPGSPLLALGINDPFDKYIFCEEDPDNMNALKTRIKLLHPDKDCFFILDNTNESLDQIFNAIPQFSSELTGLSLCVVDPFKAGDIYFTTLRYLAEHLYIDFVILIPSYMDINRNEHNYTRSDNDTIDKFIGTTEWRLAWEKRGRHLQNFGLFIADQFCKQMEKLGYIYETPEDLELVKMETGQNLPLYHLYAFSRKDLGLKFWRETKKNTNPQLKLDLG